MLEVVDCSHLEKGFPSLCFCLPWGKGSVLLEMRASSVKLFATPWTAACRAFLSITSSWSLLKLMSIESMMPSNNLIFCHPLLLLPSIIPSIRVFYSESVLRIRWPKYWSFSFSISLSSEYSGLISFRMDWLDHLAVQGTLKSLLQHHCSKASVLWHLPFFIVQLLHPFPNELSRKTKGDTREAKILSPSLFIYLSICIYIHTVALLI